MSIFRSYLPEPSPYSAYTRRAARRGIPSKCTSPFWGEEGGECDLSVLERRTAALKQLKANGYYLEGLHGAVKCFKEGSLDELDGELDLIETSLAVTD